MKVEVIESFCGLEAGKQKTVADNIANNLIQRGLVKEVVSDEAQKPKKTTTKKDETTD